MTKKKPTFRCDCCKKIKPHRPGRIPARCADCTLLISSAHLWGRTPAQLERSLALARRQVMVLSHLLRGRS